MASVASVLSLVFMLGIFFRLQVLGLISVNPKSPTEQYSPVGQELQEELLSGWAAIPKGCSGSGEAQRGARVHVAPRRTGHGRQFNSPKRTILHSISGISTITSRLKGFIPHQR